MAPEMRPGRRTDPRGGFTLVELLVTMVILLVLTIVLFETSAGVTRIWKSSTGKISGFQNARSAFATLHETLRQATLNPYTDYVNVTNNTYYFRHPDGTGATDPGSASGFVPTRFARASELHFLCGPGVDVLTGASADKNPGDALFFQAPLGGSANRAYAELDRALNSVGFYIQYQKTDQSLLPAWLTKVASANAYSFQLVQKVEATENLQVYLSTARGTYNLDWLTFAGSPRTRVLAENVLLLLLRPRIAPADETAVAATLGQGYDEGTQFGSVLCPNYHYDSRAWQSGYPASQRVLANPSGTALARIMSNQLPPVVDMALVCADAPSLARFDRTTASPPAELLVPASLFKDSAKMEADLAAYANQLSAAHVRFHIERAAVEVRGARWSNR